MGIFDILLKPGPKEVSFEVVDRKICLDKTTPGLWIKVKGLTLILMIFELSSKTKNQVFRIPPYPSPM